MDNYSSDGGGGLSVDRTVANPEKVLHLITETVTTNGKTVRKEHNIGPGGSI